MFDWSRANETELLQTCREAGISVMPGTSKELIIQLLSGEVEPEGCATNPMDSYRNALMDFLLDYWMMVRGQIDCPAKQLEIWTTRPDQANYAPKRLPGLPPNRVACRTCTDAQVMCCIVQNASNAQTIENRRTR